MNALPIVIAVCAISGNQDAPRVPPVEPSATTAAPAVTAFRRGVDAYDEGHYDLALKSFEEAYRLAPEPSTLFNIAQVQRAIGDCRKALASLDAVITASGAERSLVNRARAKRDEFEGCANAQTPAVAPPPVAAAVPANRSEALPRRIESPTPMLLVRPPPATPVLSSWLSSTWGKGCILSAGTTLGLGLAGGGLAWAAHDRANVVNDAHTWSSDIQAADSERRGLATAATVTLVASGVTAMLSGAICWAGWRRRD
jgi:hypothetical protein